MDPGRRGAVGLALAAAVVVAFVGLHAWRGRPQPAAPVQPVAVRTAAASGSELVVDVEGEVRRPGLVRLPRGSRVADALRSAGGAKPGASTANVNLARLVVDGEQIVVGAVSTQGQLGSTGGGGGADPSATVDLNAATVEQLDALPGVGPVLAQRIVDWRTAHGRFSDVAQLREVDGIGERKYGDLAKRVRV